MRYSLHVRLHEVGHNDAPDEVLESSTPFMAISVGDRMQPHWWIAPGHEMRHNYRPGDVLHVTRIEHELTKSVHRLHVYCEKELDSRE